MNEWLLRSSKLQRLVRIIIPERPSTSTSTPNEPATPSATASDDLSDLPPGTLVTLLHDGNLVTVVRTELPEWESAEP